jgi:TAT-translocated FGD2 family F420-dependent dehydrogenase
MTNLAQQRLVSFMLPHEQFPVTHLIELGQAAAQAGFGVLSSSDHFQPWQANEGHSGTAWMTLAALAGRVRTWIGTTITCPILRYNPAVVAQAFSTLSQLHPGRVFLGVGSGEALNEAAATGSWPSWAERWERLVEAIGIIRALWSGATVAHHGEFFSVDARLYDPPPQPIPLLVAANGEKSIRLAGLHGDGLITDPRTWSKFKSEWQEAAREAGKNPDEMPVLVEHFIVVGDEADAKRAAELWRFLPKVFKKYYNNPDPVVIQRQAEVEIRLDEVTAEWIVGTDPAVHLAMIRQLFDSGVAIVNVHSGQADLRKVIDFYGQSVLPQLRQ